MVGPLELALHGTDEELEALLVSDTLWGGAGSVADQAGLGGVRTDATRAVEAVLIELGELQVSMGVVNPRTAGWVSVFKDWQRRGI